MCYNLDSNEPKNPFQLIDERCRMTRIVFMGTPDFAVPSLQAVAKEFDIVAVVTQPDRPAGRGRRLASPPVKRVAQGLGIITLQPQTLRDPDVVAQLRDLAPEAVVIAAYGEILQPDVLSIPALGCINVHASLLPKYRGAAPIAATLLEGETETGVSVMLVDSGLDTGPILAQLKVPVHLSDTTLTLASRLSQLGATLLAETLPSWLAGKIVPQPQDHEAATYAPRISKSDGQIDWTQPADRIDRQCRAYHPWPGAFTYWNNQRLKVLRAYPLPMNTVDVEPGTVVETPQGIAVISGQGAIILDKIQLAGKRAMSGIEFARGQRSFIGSRLGTSQVVNHGIAPS